MTRLLKIISCCLLITSFVGCSDNYEQQYNTFNDFNKMNERSKGWFPHIISSDAYNFKNCSYLDSLCAFGTFSYSKNNFYDSIFKSINTKQISFSLFEQKVNQHNKRKPGWFLNLENVAGNKFETIQIERFYILRNTQEKIIYFILSN